MEQVCIIGGGATGAALLWCLAQDEQARAETQVTLIHNGEQLGGHSLTVPVSHGGTTVNVDLGVQLISPMIYANLRLMLGLDSFSSLVPMTDFDELYLAFAYPDLNGAPQNWSNFPAYQGDPLFAMYTPQLRSNSETFQNFMEFAMLGWAGKSVQDYFASANGYGSAQDKQNWIDYFLWPYLSIINGYGAALMDETLVGDLIPFFLSLPGFDTPLGSFTDPGKGWQRFTKGAQSWVLAMALVANQLQPGSTVLTGCTVTEIETPTSGDTRPVVVWKDSNGATNSQTFDKVVTTLDMQTNAALLANSPYWADIYSKHIDPTLWSLQPGACYIHTDPTVLSPHLRNTNGQTGFEQETLQFTAYFSPQTAYPYYDLYKTYTTYIQSSLLGNPAAAGVYNTMYGYIPDPKVDPMPDPDSIVYSSTWIHSKFAPSFASGAKKSLYQAQAPGATKSYPGQPPSGVYFAGNNTTYDSEDGALEAAMIIAKYAFDVEYPFWSLPPDDRHLVTQALAIFLYDTYTEIMFPGTVASHPSGHWYGLAASAARHALFNH